MDPDEALARLRTWAVEQIEGRNDRTAEAAESFLALDGWLSRGGFLPGEWSQR